MCHCLTVAVVASPRGCSGTLVNVSDL